MGERVPARDRYEREVVRRVLDTLLREDHRGLASRGRPMRSGWWWVPPVGVLLRVRPDGFLAELRIATAAVWLPPPGVPDVPGEPASWIRRDDLAGVLAALAPAGDTEAEAGWAAFTAECARELAAQRMTAPALPGLLRRLRHGLPAGPDGTLLAESLAAHADHPVYPTGHSRAGLSGDELRAYAPEFAPSFELCWAVVPGARHTGPVPPWWPSPADVGLADLPVGHGLLPVHPLAAATCGATLAPGRYLAVAPTLSMRTVMVLDDPLTHLKLPLPTATLGLRNVRQLHAGALADGALMGRLLSAVAAREPRFAGRITHADESRYGGVPDGPMYLARRYPGALAGATVLPVAALTAPAPPGPIPPARTPLDPAVRDPRDLDGGGRSDGGGGPAPDTDPAGTTAAFLLDLLPAGTLDTYLDLLVDWHVALWLRYGVALEAHQQNISLVLAPGRPLGLVYRDDDGPRVDPPRLAAALGEPLPAARFNDWRIPVRDPGELADVFTTITLHLCAAAPLLALRRAGRTVPDPATALRPRLLAALHRWCDPDDPGSRAAAALLRDRVLAADRLPVKAMVTAGTLLPKQRLGITDVNKYYLRTGPNYLAAGPDDPTRTHP